MKLTLIVPGLLARSATAIAVAPAFARFARHATGPEIDPRGAAHTTLAALGAADGAPVAALAALGAGVDSGDDYVLFAEPVTLVAGRNDVVLAGRVADLAAEDTVALLAALNAHFVADGLAFFAPRPDAWFVRMGALPDLATTPLDLVLGEPIYSHLPSGADARTWQRWQSEAQMLLFAHPVNAERERRGLPPVSGLWLWGGGRRTDLVVAAAPVAFAAAGAAGDLVRGFARQLGQTDDRLPDAFGAMLAQWTTAADRVAVMAALDDDAALAGFAQRWLVPAVAALESGPLTSLDLLGSGDGRAARWGAQRPTRLARFTGAWRSARFVLPERVDDP